MLPTITSYTGKKCTPKVDNVSNSDIELQLVGAKTLSELHNACSLVREKNGFDIFTIMLRGNATKNHSSLFMSREYHFDFTDHYLKSKYYLCDPVIRLANETKQPLIWSSEYYFRSLRNDLSTSEGSVLSDAIDFGMRGVCIFPFFGPHGITGLLRFSNDHYLDIYSEKLSVRPVIQELARFSEFLFVALVRILGIFSSDSHPLSTREKDVLSYIAFGKQPIAVAEILRISEHTVTNHLRTIRSKLSARNTAHAVAKAVWLNEIQPF